VVQIITIGTSSIVKINQTMKRTSEIKQLAGFVILLSLHFSCNPKENKSITTGNASFQNLQSLQWMLGSWQNQTAEGIFTETWTKLNDSIYRGTSVFLNGEDTLFSEEISLEQRGLDVFYIPIVSDQNNGEPVIFKRTDFVENKEAIKLEAIFENPGHDFPNKIKYWAPTPDSLIAEVSGNGKKELFSMVRLK
jgi:hypothetical protein